MSTKEKTQESAVEFKELGTLDDFSGFDNTTDESGNDFWNDNDTPGTDAKDVIDEIKKDGDNKDESSGDENNDNPDEKPKTKSELAEELFKDDEEDDNSDVNDDDLDNDGDKPKQNKVKSTSIATLNFLKDKGLFDYELEDGEELTDELAEEILEDKFDENIDNRIEELFDELPQVVKDLNKYAMNGGDLNKFFGSLKQQTSSTITANLDMEKEENQELVSRQMLKEEGYDDDYIDTQIEFLKDSGKLKMFSGKKYTKWSKDNEQKQQALLKQQTEHKKKQKEQIRQYKNNVRKLVNDSEDIGNIKLSRKDKKELPSYIVDKTIKLENGAIISERDKDLYEVLQDEVASVQLAYLLKNRNKDKSFNFKNIETIVETKVAKKVKENVRRNKTNTPKKSISSSRSSQRKELADFF